MSNRNLTVLAVASACIGAALALALPACAAAKSDAAGASYASDLAACVAATDASAELHACWLRANLAWGLVDAGKDGQ
jgi:hypothetical protein